MRLVTFAREQAPHAAGDKRLVPDEVAARLEREGLLAANVSYPENAPAPSAKKPARSILKPVRPASGIADERKAN
jgi:hypothetical protein